jgi:hypothetical protein
MAPVVMALQAMRGVALVVTVTVEAEVGDLYRMTARVSRKPHDRLERLSAVIRDIAESAGPAVRAISAPGRSRQAEGRGHHCDRPRDGRLHFGRSPASPSPLSPDRGPVSCCAHPTICALRRRGTNNRARDLEREHESQGRSVDEYLIDFKASQAAIRACYAVRFKLGALGAARTRCRQIPDLDRGQPAAPSGFTKVCARISRRLRSAVRCRV